jgi:crotonobetainyl-CoA:carnitine CoA-transferase CaiB-like acyl-CoA transferase
VRSPLDAQGVGPLAGVTVVEAASYVSGPFTSLMLADLGATVHKVEPPSGDPYRRFGPQDEDCGLLFRAINRNKRSHFVDLKSGEGLSFLHRLLAESDVLISNWRPAVAATFGLTAEFVAARWPQLVWVRVSGYGQDGPLADSPVFDPIIQARTGTVAAAAGGGEPHLLPMFLADKVTAMTAVQSALAALSRRAVMKRGSVVDISMLDAMAYFNGPDVSAGYQERGACDERVARQLVASRTLATKDGTVVLSPVSGRQLKRTLEALGLGERSEALKAAPDATRMTEMFYEELDGKLEGETTEHWVRVLTAADVPVSAVATMEEHLSDPQVVHNRLYQGYETDEGSEGRWLGIRHPALFDGKSTPHRITAPDPLPAP